ncbi:MAG: HAD-IA family hydrolase [Pseudomonadales bacterium]|jgi:putative hydrolase of the HAD superfamily|nr:HAD-IA family hydrolase [Pseudomonadales bacterium]MDP6472940.1 HAD-IA family hydrolase [Pseudomonadales bacterium]MDP6826303.1 HAD-IA family hydrolase [Pseudomonadales bacterium]MDP6972780.1 HAD-IA family hydrolase [Pseudomonadales bacterium]|tara:strand:+ start:534 stop:1181 length:648 start_codon:yes stop_codon:yes gene_type:complete
MQDTKAIIWDFGGVLTTSPFDAFNRFEDEHGIPRDFIRTVNATNPDRNAWAKFESSSVSIEEFDILFEAESRALGHPIPGSRVIELLSGDIRPRMVSVLEFCSQHFKCACITNNVKSGSGPGMARSQTRADAMAAVMAVFDLVVESSVEGIRKPNPRIYEMTCERLEIDPVQAVFLDDLGINLKPAKEMGMRTIKVVTEAQAIDDLADLTGLSLP